MAKFQDKQYVKHTYGFLYSPAWKNLSLAAREIYTQIKASRNLKNSRGKTFNRSDDHIKFGFSDSNGMSKPTFRKGLQELIDKGFIGVVTPGEFPGKKAVYAIIDDWRKRDAGQYTLKYQPTYYPYKGEHWD